MMMDRIGTLLTFVTTGLLVIPTQRVCGDDNGTSNPRRQSVSQLERRLDEINRQLDGLPQFSLRSGVGAIGFRSQPHDTESQHEWIKIQLDGKHLIDEVVLVPTLLRDPASGFRAEGFPLEFRIVVGDGSSESGAVVASFGRDDQLQPRLAPVVVRFEKTLASWVRVEADVLSPRQFDGKYLLQFAEILVFSDQTNVALGQSVDSSSNVSNGSDAWDETFAFDGFTPYLMNSAEGSESLAFVGYIEAKDECWID